MSKVLVKMFAIKLITLAIFAASTQADVLKVSVYYESLCPYSKQFIVDQLYPAYQLIPEYFGIFFLPYGNAETTVDEDGNVIFTCQHGPKECYGNLIHACALAVNLENATNFIACDMDTEDPSDDINLKQCADETGISWDAVQECYLSGYGDELMVVYAELTEFANIPGTPTVIFNDVYDENLQDLATSDFLSTLCLLLNNEPSVCSSLEQLE